ncbi:hypothetical protein ACH4A3_07965 [Streptomyces sp. NPDC018007]|uniref:hypothetical protein n=1 Tax=Streptomyces sp. NPDC018007 TaxID=3365029 RepID=UPI0037B137AE
MSDNSPQEIAPGVTVSYEPDGTRVVSRSLTDSDGKTLVFTHSFPDATQHHYREVAGDEFPLHTGKIAFPDNLDRPYEGKVFFTWRPTPQVRMEGTRNSSPKDIADLFSDASSTTGMWRTAPSLILGTEISSIPDQPSVKSAEADPSTLGDLRIEERVHVQLGDGDSLDEMTFLLPNGWRADDASFICDPENLALTPRNGRTTAEGDGWTVVFDLLPSINLKEWRRIKDLGGYSFTHCGRLTRTDGSPFTSEEGCATLDRIGLGLRLALGRRTSCLLPVGFAGGSAVWALWSATAVDPMSNASDWLDSSTAAKQVGELISQVLSFTTTTSSLQSFKNALAYYIAAAVDVDVHLQASLPISGLQLLTFYSFVTAGSLTSKDWANLAPKERVTEWEIRKLLDKINVDLTIPAHFLNLAKIGHQMAAAGAKRDALGVVIKMRNVATHPTKQQAGDYTNQQWAEAGMLSRYWLCLALLHMVGYKGEIAAVMQSRPRHHGELRETPWCSTSGKPWKVGVAPGA